MVQKNYDSIDKPNIQLNNRSLHISVTSADVIQENVNVF